MVQIVWTDEALAWLREIHDYISADSPDAAKRVVAGIIDRAEQLAEFPELGQRLLLRQMSAVTASRSSACITAHSISRAI